MTTLEIAYFDGAKVELVEEDEFDYNDPGAKEALVAFSRLTAADRLADSRHVYAYYRDFHESVGGEDWLDAEMGIPERPEDIWAHVTPGDVFLAQDDASDDWYVVMEAECAWEDEHGLMLVWHKGQKLTKVGEYDGHLSNVSAFDDDELISVVYYGNDPEHTTRLKD